MDYFFKNKIGMKISAAEVGKLRKMTGAGMMDCKKSLVESEGDFDKAIEILRNKGQKIADKRADREITEGVAIAVVNSDKNKGVAIKLNCETDFVAKNEDFVKLATDIAKLALTLSNKEELLAADLSGVSVQAKLIEQTGVIGEKIEIGGFEKIEAPFVGMYIHINKIAALVGLSEASDKAADVAKDISMQVASMGATSLTYKDFDPAYIESETKARIAVIEKDNIELERLGKTLKNVPQYISMAQLTPEVLAKAEEDAKSELKAEGKPEKIWDKILPGKMERFISDNTSLDQEQCLLDQKFIKDEKKSVSEYIKILGADVKITTFIKVSI